MAYIVTAYIVMAYIVMADGQLFGIKDTHFTRVVAHSAYGQVFERVFRHVFRRVFRHVFERVFRHVFMRVFRHVFGRVFRHVFRRVFDICIGACARMLGMCLDVCVYTRVRTCF